MCVFKGGGKCGCLLLCVIHTLASTCHFGVTSVFLPFLLIMWLCASSISRLVFDVMLLQRQDVIDTNLIIIYYLLSKKVLGVSDRRQVLNAHEFWSILVHAILPVRLQVMHPLPSNAPTHPCPAAANCRRPKFCISHRGLKFAETALLIVLYFYPYFTEKHKLIVQHVCSKGKITSRRIPC